MILSEKHELMRNRFRDFAEAEFTDELLQKLEETGEFDWDIHYKMAAAGFMGLKIPVEYAGQGEDNLSYALMVEELARVSPVLSLYANTSNSLGAGPLLFCGSEEQKQKYLPPVARGESNLVFALTEPGAGSDAGGTLTTAVEDGDFYVLNGRKTFISGAPFADKAIVYAKTDPSLRGSRGISMFIMDMKLPGVSLGMHEKKMGIIGYPTSDIVMEDVRVHKSDLLGPLHNGFVTAMKTLDGGRLGVAAQAVGIAQGCLDETVKFAKIPDESGQIPAKSQNVSFMIADMATELEAARELVYSTAVMRDANVGDITKRCSMAKYFATEACNRIARQAVQLHGIFGLVQGYKVERLYRDARITTIYEGTSQVQQMVISGSVLK
ncbi:MAG: acyl-CoA dehydrogenase [Clostridiales bacterium]|nr:acyl-CoA dehydrogenase [Clostridiales bacterium]